MKLGSRIILFSIISFVTILYSNNILSQGESDLAETHFKAATSYYNQGNYEKALEEFKEAYRLMPLPEVTYNMAQCYERLGQLETSIESYKKYLDEKPDAKDAKAVQEKIANLEEKLASTGILIDVSEEGAIIYVDGQEVATSPIEGLIQVSPGNHELKVEKEGFQTFTMNFSVAAGLSQEATITLNPKVKKDEGKEGEGGGGEIEPIVPEKKKGKMGGYIAGYAISGAVLLGGVATGVVALVKVNKANDAADTNPDLYQTHKDKAKTFALVTDVLIPAGAVGLVVTSIVLGVKKPWKEKRDVALTPMISDEFGGVLLKGSF